MPVCLVVELVYDSHFYASATYVEENVALYAKKTGIAPSKTEAFEDMKSAVGNTWLVIEAVPEKIQLKIDTFAELDALLCCLGCFHMPR